jgi:cytoskeletal protein CcmA (bactofilin family)
MFGSNKKAPESAPLSNNNVETLLGKTALFKGSLSSDNSIRIEGGFEGDITAKGDIFIGPVSRVTAELNGRNITVSGHVVGNINVSEKLELLAGATLIGDIEVKKLVIEDGAVFKGKSETKNSPEKIPPPPAVKK